MYRAQGPQARRSPRPYNHLLINREYGSRCEFLNLVENLVSPQASSHEVVDVGTSRDLVEWTPARGIVNLLRAARSCPVKSTLPIVLSRRTSPHGIDAPICQDDRLGGLDVCLARSIVCHDPLVDLAGQ